MQSEIPGAPPEYLRLRQIIPDILPVSKSKFYELVAAGKLPRGKRLSANVVVYSRAAIIAAVEG